MKLQIDTEKEEVTVLDESVNIDDLRLMMMNLNISNYKIVFINIINNPQIVEKWFPIGNLQPYYPDYYGPIIAYYSFNPYSVTC